MIPARPLLLAATLTTPTCGAVSTRWSGSVASRPAEAACTEGSERRTAGTTVLTATSGIMAMANNECCGRPGQATVEPGRTHTDLGLTPPTAVVVGRDPRSALRLIEEDHTTVATMTIDDMTAADTPTTTGTSTTTVTTITIITTTMTTDSTTTQAQVPALRIAYPWTGGAPMWTFGDRGPGRRRILLATPSPTIRRRMASRSGGGSLSTI